MLSRLRWAKGYAQIAALWRRDVVQPLARSAADVPRETSTYRHMIDRRPVSIIEYRNRQNLIRWRQKYHAQALASESRSSPQPPEAGARA